VNPWTLAAPRRPGDAQRHAFLWHRHRRTTTDRLDLRPRPVSGRRGISTDPRRGSAQQPLRVVVVALL